MGSGSQSLAPGVQVAVTRLCFCPSVKVRRRFAARLDDAERRALQRELAEMKHVQRGVVVEPYVEHSGEVRRWIVSLNDAPLCADTYELEWSWERQAQTGATGHNEVRAYESDIFVLDAVTLLGELA